MAHFLREMTVKLFLFCALCKKYNQDIIWNWSKRPEK